MKIIAIGEILWDVFGDSEHLGGASFNFAAHARRLGNEVLFVSAVGDDDRGRRALTRAADLGLSTEFIRHVPDEATGIVTVRLDPAGQPAYTLHRPAAYDCVSLDDRDFERLAAFQPDWIYFGTLHQIDPRARSVTQKLLDSNRHARRFYDVNLRPNSYTPELVLQLLQQANAVKLNQAEVEAVVNMSGGAHRTVQEFCRSSAETFAWEAVCVTQGQRGCALMVNGVYVEAPGYPVKVADAVGAGDAFAAAFLHGLQQGWDPKKIGNFANSLGALVASREGAVPDWTLEEYARLIM